MFQRYRPKIKVTVAVFFLKKNIVINLALDFELIFFI